MMKLVTVLLTSALVVGGLGAGVYSMAEGQSSPTIKTNTAIQADIAEQTVSTEKAKEMALDVTEGTQVTKVHLDDDDDDKREYEMEVVKEDTKYEVDVDAATGQVLKIEQDDRDDDDIELQNVSPKISLDEAKKKALAEVNGTITEAELDDDDNRLLYEIKIQTSNYREAEVKIDAATGKVLKVEMDD